MLFSMLDLTGGPYMDYGIAGERRPVPHYEIMVGSQQPVASNSHAQLPSYSEIWLFVSPVSRFTFNKKA